MTVICECEECRWNKAGRCQRDVLNVAAICSVTAPAACNDYVCDDGED